MSTVTLVLEKKSLLSEAFTPNKDRFAVCYLSTTNFSACSTNETSVFLPCATIRHAAAVWMCVDRNNVVFHGLSLNS